MDKDVNNPVPSDKEKADQENLIALNPNPRANENISKEIKEEESTEARWEAGSEITDGEDG